MEEIDARQAKILEKLEAKNGQKVIIVNKELSE